MHEVRLYRRVERVHPDSFGRLFAFLVLQGLQAVTTFAQSLAPRVREE